MLFSAVSLLSLVAAVSAHGHVKTVIADGVSYSGGIPHGAPANAVGWKANNQDNGFVEPNSFGNADIICHKGATPATNGATVRAGGSVTLQVSSLEH
jgi:lytic cellulose monooxygenase (C1-hydroxylating)